MRPPSGRFHDSPMSTNESAGAGASGFRVWLELDLEADPIHGTLQAPGGAASPFSGWLGLTAAIEGLRRPPATRQGRHEVRGIEEHSS